MSNWQSPSKGESFLAQGHGCLCQWLMTLFLLLYEILTHNLYRFQFIQQQGIHNKDQKLSSDNTNMREQQKQTDLIEYITKSQFF